MFAPISMMELEMRRRERPGRRLEHRLATAAGSGTGGGDKGKEKARGRASTTTATRRRTTTDDDDGGATAMGSEPDLAGAAFGGNAQGSRACRAVARR